MARAKSKKAEDNHPADGETAPAGFEPATAGLIIEKIAAPLMMAAERGVRAEAEGDRVELLTSRFFELVDASVTLSRALMDKVAVPVGQHWNIAAAAAGVVGEHFRSTSRVPTVAEIGGLAVALIDSLGNVPDEGAAKAVTADFSLIGANLQALAPVVSATGRFSFGRTPFDLLREVTTRLTGSALGMTGRLTGIGDRDMLTISPLYFAILGAASEFYRENHFIEMDRLMNMPAEERREYVRTHERKIPLDGVWEAVDLRLALLEAMTTHLPMPGAPAAVQGDGGE